MSASNKLERYTSIYEQSFHHVLTNNLKKLLLLFKIRHLETKRNRSVFGQKNVIAAQPNSRKCLTNDRSPNMFWLRSQKRAPVFNKS